MRHYFLSSHNPSNKTNTQYRVTWNHQYNNTLKRNMMDTTSPLPSKGSNDRFSDETKSNTNSSAFNTPSVTKRTYSRIRPSIENTPEIEGIKRNFALLRNKIDKLDSIINDNNPVVVKKKIQKEKPVIKKLNISNIKGKVNQCTPKYICNSDTNRKKKISLKTLKKEENNIYNKISSFNIEYPVCLTEGNIRNDKQHKRTSSEFNKNKENSFYVPSKQTNLNYIMANLKKG